MPPVKNRPYDFLRRHYPHQVIGSKFVYFLSACKHKLPCSVWVYYSAVIGNLQAIFWGRSPFPIQSRFLVMEENL